MKISKTALIKGTEVDMPMRNGETSTYMAIRFFAGNFELYDFNTEEVSYRYSNLTDLVRNTNRIFNLNDTVGE